MKQMSSLKPVIHPAGQDSLIAMTHLKDAFTNMHLLRDSLTLLREDGFNQLPESRRLKIQRHFREKLNDPQHTSPILTLCGDWLRQSGFECNEHVRLISLHQLIIISPEQVPIEPNKVKLVQL